MENKYMVFVVPGLSDKAGDSVIRLTTENTCAKVFNVGWRTPTQDPSGYYFERLAEFLKQIDIAILRGFKVVLLGTSAGGSFVVNAFAKRQDVASRVINLSGRLTTEEGPTVRSFAYYQQTDPVFVESVKESEVFVNDPSQTLRNKFVAFVPLYDELVPVKTMAFKGAVVNTVPTALHLINIAAAFTVYRKVLLQTVMAS
jgi:hypothetical protein